MIIRFWGTRGSIASAGENSRKYGGNTPCVSLAQDDTLVILDAGSGLRQLAQEEYHKTFKSIHILLTHLHMDHIQGLGFFKLFFDPTATIHLWGPPSSTASLQMRLTRYLSPPLFPVRLRDFTCKLYIKEMSQSRLVIEPFRIRTDFVLHPGPTLGFRITNGVKTICYIPDHEPALGSINMPFDPEWTSGYELAKDVDLLIHDAQFSDDEYLVRQGWGHSSYSHTLEFASLTKVKRLELFHHDPNHDDADLESLFNKHVPGKFTFPVHLAAEHTSIQW